MLIDDVTIRVKAGNGGAGAVAFNKNLMELGPVGGSGGRGGSVYVEGIADLGALRHFRNVKAVEAQNGKDGRGQFRDGQDGADALVRVPAGTVVHNVTTKDDFEITKVGERVMVAKGGHGGKGNFHFRSPRNTTPRQFQKGLPGDAFLLRLELKLIADVGIVGLPNVGKSSLLNELTAARAKVANYEFTTLEPNLGVYYELILADIPGLIEGASRGKGLGVKFLRHIERTRTLFHCIAADSKTPVGDYRTIRKELAKYNKELLEKPEYVILTRTDLVSEKERQSVIKKLALLQRKIILVSIYDWESIEAVKKALNKSAREKKL